jgi:excisionase family DNA binding protein
MDTNTETTSNNGSSLKIEEWLTAEEAAAYLNVSVGSLRNLTSDGKVPYYKLGNRNRYLLQDLRDLLLTNKRGV